MKSFFPNDFLDIWEDELARMNENKKGKKYEYLDSFILIIDYIRAYLHLSYRQTEGIIKATIEKSMPEYKQPPAAPSYSQICKRTNKLDIDINSSIDSSNGDYVIIAEAVQV